MAAVVTVTMAPTPSTFNSITTATITSWMTVAAVTASAACDKSGCETDKGKVAGIAVGCVLGVLFMAGALALWLRRRGKQDTLAEVREVAPSEDVVAHVHPPTPVETRAPYRVPIVVGREGCYTPVQYEGEETYVYQPPSNSSKGSLADGLEHARPR
ncbi:hypothetical protein CspeluHIS016_0105680 [Cutaneotrichosporon spelunceum]|uniref:Transmembrane protein n=1 Tax=Cutaneotrichosporon spelunceum TaxID=1672016 RepID=A0AAD3TP67_9TREE|nr:hypothetical protein CspeluHIS016_0105680 [Cutaneotrichosporon spelunceum]